MVQKKPNRKGKRRAGAGKRKSLAFFKREAEWMTWMNVAPFGIGVVIALIFWFTR